MRFDAGMTDVPTAGTAVALSSDAGLDAEERILWAQFKGKTGNTGTVFVGIADVSATHGWSLANDDDIGLTLNPGEHGGSIKLGDINFDAATNGDDVEWALLLK